MLAANSSGDPPGAGEFPHELVLHDARLATAGLNTLLGGGSFLRVTYQGKKDPAVVYDEEGTYDCGVILVILAFGSLCAPWTAWSAVFAVMRLRERRRRAGLRPTERGQ